MITGTLNNEEERRRLDIDQLTDIARKYVDAWESMNNALVDYMLTRALADPAQFIRVKVPEALYAKPFPTLLQCTDPSCKVLDFFQSRGQDDEQLLRKMSNPGRHFRVKGRKRIKCKRPGCNGYMRQLPFTAIHRCGHIRQLTIPPGLRRTTNLGFDDRGGASMMEGKFFDVDNKKGSLATTLQDKCPSCRAQYEGATGNSLVGRPVRNTEQFFPHNVQYLSLSTEMGKVIALITNFLGDPNSILTKEGADISRGIMLCLIGRATAQDLISHAESLSAAGDTETINEDRIRNELQQTVKTREGDSFEYY